MATKKKARNHSTEMKRDDRPTRHSVMRAVSLFLDGMSRAVVLSFGPSLVYRLAYGGTLKLGLDCAKVAYPLSIVVAAFLLGRGTGCSVAEMITIPEEKLPKYVARVSGAAISLHVFTFGAGLQSVWWLVLIRFLSAVLVGALCVITKEDVFAEETQDSLEDRLETGLNDATTRGTRRRHSYVDFASGTTKIYMTAYAVSILSGGLLYRHATGDATFRALTDSKQFTLSPLFLVAVSLTAESILRCVFRFVGTDKNEEKLFLEIPGDSTESHITTYTSKVEELDRLSRATPAKARDRRESTSCETFVPCHDLLESTSSVNVKVASPPNRNRLGTSDSEFFDCRSVFSDMEEFSLFDEGIGECCEVDVARYVDAECVYANGSPAYVPNGDTPDSIPTNYLAICGWKRLTAEKMWKATQEWRRQQNVWKIHTIPNKWFTEIKKAYPHTIHGISKTGFPVIYEQPGKMNLKQLFREGCDVSDMVRHYIFFMEYISNHVCMTQEVREKMGPKVPPHSSSCWGMLIVMDVKGAGLSHLSGDVLAYLKKAGDINNSHFPLNLRRAFLVNSPFWLAGAWSSIRSVLPESVQVDILPAHKYLTALHEYIDDDQIPQEYGGSSPYKLGEHPFEQELHTLVADAANGVYLKEEAEQTLQADPIYPIDHNTSSWPRESDGLTVKDGVKGGTWRTTYDARNSPSDVVQHPRRRRATSTEMTNTSSLYVNLDEDRDDLFDDKKGQYGGETQFFAIVSVMYALWSAIQGVIETAIPLWVVIPPELGGLGYAPSRSGVAMFCSAVVLLWVMRTKVSKLISKLPSEAPIRSFRIGVSAESVLLFLLATVPKSAGPKNRSDAVLVMAVTIIFMSCIVLSSMFGRASSTIMHRIVSERFAQSERKQIGWFASRYGVDRLMRDCESGKFTSKINLMAEICGVLAVAPISAWSLAEDRPTPFDGTCCLFISSLVTLVLYVCSFSLHGEFVAPHPRDRCGTDAHSRKCGSFLCEFATVPVSD